MKNKQREFKIEFYGITKVKAHTMDEARANVESAKNITSDGGIRTKSMLHRFAEGVATNLGALVTLLLMMFMLTMWADTLKLMQTLPKPFDTFGILVLIMFILQTMRFPRTIPDLIGIQRYEKWK